MKTTNLEEMRIAMETYYEEVRGLLQGGAGVDPLHPGTLSLHVSPRNSVLLPATRRKSGIWFQLVLGERSICSFVS